MLAYPVRIFLALCGAQDPARVSEFRMRIRLSRRLEAYLNRDMEQAGEGEVRTYHYGNLAALCGAEEETVRNLLRSNDGGADRFTVYRNPARTGPGG